MKGRKAIPSKILNLRGGTSHSHKKARENEPDPPSKMPKCPDHLDAEAKAEWTRAGDILESVGLMTGLDMAVLAGYCDAYSQWAKSTLKVQEMGMVYQKQDKTPALNPYLRVARESYDRMIKAAVLLGLSPSSRVNLKVEKPRKKNKAELFMLSKDGTI